MRTFDQIYRIAVKRKGEAELDARRPTVKTKRTLRKIGDDRWLSMMAKRVFQAGFVWKVVENKWDGFETAFEGFDLDRVWALDGDGVERLRDDKRIVRNLQKIKSVIANARFLLDVAEEHGSFARLAADWPSDDVIGLWDLLKRRGSRLGGRTGPLVLRSMGRDTFMLSTDVVARLIAEGVVDRNPTSKGGLASAQTAFNTWASESGRSLGEISMVLACSIDS